MNTSKYPNGLKIWQPQYGNRRINGWRQKIKIYRSDGQKEWTQWILPHEKKNMCIKPKIYSTSTVVKSRWRRAFFYRRLGLVFMGRSKKVRFGLNFMVPETLTTERAVIFMKMAYRNNLIKQKIIYPYFLAEWSGFRCPPFKDI